MVREKKKRNKTRPVSPLLPLFPLFHLTHCARGVLLYVRYIKNEMVRANGIFVLLNPAGVLRLDFRRFSASCACRPRAYVRISIPGSSRSAAPPPRYRQFRAVYIRACNRANPARASGPVLFYLIPSRLVSFRLIPRTFLPAFSQFPVFPLTLALVMTHYDLSCSLSHQVYASYEHSPRDVPWIESSNDA